MVGEEVMRRAFSLFLLLSIFGGLCQAQSADQEKSPERMIQLSLPHLGGQALESAVDPSEYILGPGDRLVVNIWGEEDMSLPLTVTPEGKLLIPSVGELEVSGLSLQEAKVKVEEAVLKRFRNVRITTNLTSLRRFRIMVIGEVARPGTWVAQATDRVSDLLGWAGEPELTEPNSETISEERAEFHHLSLGQPSQRNIVVTHRDGSQFRADIFRFLVLGDRGRDPYLQDGDVVYVPPVERVVNIYGAVNEPGNYEWVEGEGVFDLIELARGLRPDADSSLILLTRFNPDGITARTMRIDLGGQSDLTLMADDRVFIRSRPKYHLKEEVYLQGEVLYPGVYPIREGFTTLSQVIKEAGGFTQQAAMELTSVFRVAKEEKEDREFERLKEIPVSDMTRTEYEYFKMRARERSGELSLDFEKLFGQGDLSEDILLRNGDRIEVPSKPQVVWVLGQVGFPGGVGYIPGKPLSYYVEVAGGYSPNAQRGKIKVIRAKGKGWVWPKQAGRLKPGDTIWVPEKPERNWWQIFREVITVGSQAATLYIVIKQAVKP